MGEGSTTMLTLSDKETSCRHFLLRSFVYDRCTHAQKRHYFFHLLFMSEEAREKQHKVDGTTIYLWSTGTTHD